MNEDITLDSKFNPLDTILRTSGIVGFVYVVFGGFALAGGNPIWLIHPAEIAIVFGVTFCGLLSTHQVNFLAYIPKAVLACVIKPEPNREYCQISESGRRYAATGGGLAVMLGIINTMSNLEDPEMVGKKVAAALSGTFLGIFLAYGIGIPLARLVSLNQAQEFLYFRIVERSVTGFATGLSPIMAVEIGRRSLDMSVQPSADELEENCKDAAKGG